MKGKQVFITGSTQGIGRAAAMELARLGASVTVHGRDAARAESIAAEIRQATGNPSVDSIAFDLSSLKELRAAAQRYLDGHARLDVLCLNAGVFLGKRELSAEGHEKTVATRFLGHFLLTQLFLPSLKASGDGRIIITAAPPNGMKANFEDLDLEKSYGAIKAVTQGMGLLLMAQLEIAEKMRGQGVTVNFLHPGVIDTKLLSQMPWIFRKIQALVGGFPAKGADTLVYLASEPSLKGSTGQFFIKRKPKPYAGAISQRDNQQRAYELGLKITA